MKNAIIRCLLLLFSFPTEAQSLRWLDIEKKSVYRIDIKKSVLENSSNSNEWQEIGKVELKNIQEKDILAGNEIICLNTDDKNLVYLLMGCTNQVYQFNYKTLLLERIDKTYYGGFNCLSTKFIRKNFRNTGKRILGEEYLGNGKFGISFMDGQHPGAAYNATISTDCNCNIINSDVSTIR